MCVCVCVYVYIYIYMYGVKHLDVRNKYGKLVNL